jgi:hypothetical protein
VEKRLNKDCLDRHKMASKSQTLRQGDKGMNIHYLSTSTMLSSEANSVQVVHMCEAFAASGHEVTLFAYFSGSNRLPDAEILEKYGVTHRFKLVLKKRKIPWWLGGTYFDGVGVALRSLWRRPDIVYGRNLPAFHILLVDGCENCF